MIFFICNPFVISQNNRKSLLKYTYKSICYNHLRAPNKQIFSYFYIHFLKSNEKTRKNIKISEKLLFL